MGNEEPDNQFDLFADLAARTDGRQEDAAQWDEQEEAEAPRDLFAFYQSEEAVIAGVVEILREKLLPRKDITPHQIVQIGQFLFGLERLPRLTPDFSMVLTLIYRFNHESSYQQIGLTSDTFQLAQGGTAYNEDVGGDSFSSTTLEVGIGWRDEASSWMDVWAWINSFSELAADSDYDLEINDYGEDIDWSIAEEEDVSDLWSEQPDDGDF